MESGTTNVSMGEASGDPGASTGWRLFHLVYSPAPRHEDFLSMLGRQQIPRPRQRDGLLDAETLRIAAGVSCFEAPDQARAMARRYPRLGRFVAEIYIPDDDCAIEVVRTLNTPGHFTVWASPAYFLSRVVSVTPV
jgi:hypothetical protein